MKLYPYQNKNSKEIMELWQNHNSILYQLPTGGGKTVVINDIIEKIINNKILILVHRQEIIFQIRDRLKKRGITAGVLIGSFEENLDADIIIGSILTVARDTRLQGILERNFDYMIIDEAHHACSASYVKTIHYFKEHNPNYKLLGVTATPYRKDGKKLSKIFDVLIQGPTYSELRKDGYLADYTCYAAKLENLSEVDLSGGDFKLSSLSKYMRANWLIQKAIQMYKDKGEKKQMLVFCVDKKHAIQVKQSYIDQGFTKIALIDSDTPDSERKLINQQYRDKILEIIISIQTLTEGVDLPNTGVIQLLRPTKSINLYLQILGRGIRLKDDKSKLIILDLSNNTYEHGLLDSQFIWSLNNDEPNPNKKITKIGGRNKHGKFTINEDEIEEDYLEIEEMSHNDFLLENVNGIEIAEKENGDKDKLIYDLYKELSNTLTQKCRVPNINFVDWRDNLIKYNYWDDIIINFKGKELANINYKNGVITYDVGWKTKVTPNFYYLPIIKGKVAEFLYKPKIQLLLTKSFMEIKDILNSKINIHELRNKIKEIELEKCVFKINTQLKNKNYIFKLHTEEYSNSISSRHYGRFNTIEFLEEPKRLKVNNNIHIRGNNSQHFPNVHKDVIIDILYDNWYKLKK